MALRNPLDVGESLLTLMNMFINTKKTVTSNPILPGTTIGFMRNDTEDTNTNNVDVR